MAILKLFVVALLLCIQCAEHASIDDKNLQNKDDCTYEDGRFGRIDLSRVGLKNGIPAFRNVANGDYYYSYNPCYSFSEAPFCTNVAGCQIFKDGSISFPLGFNSRVTWSITADGRAALIYSTETRQLTVNLICSTQLDELHIYGEYELHQFNFTLSSKCACWNGCVSVNGGISSPSGTSIIFLFLSSLTLRFFLICSYI